MMNKRKEKIKDTKEFWQIYYKEDLSNEDAVEISDNMMALISFLDEIVQNRTLTIK
ncbi:MAG: hypothetical protein PHX18_05280 [Candidatus Gastranaerophilales bacterium]|nr:hypothetical protein [Candidatus Gastranaerophilales bacterium]